MMDGGTTIVEKNWAEEGEVQGRARVKREAWAKVGEKRETKLGSEKEARGETEGEAKPEAQFEGEKVATVATIEETGEKKEERQLKPWVNKEAFLNTD